jgi:hypothetical protein
MEKSGAGAKPEKEIPAGINFIHIPVISFDLSCACHLW